MKIKKLKIKLNKDNEYSDYRYFMPKSNNIKMTDGRDVDEAVQSLKDKIANLKEQANYLINKAPLVKYAEGASIILTDCAEAPLRKLTIEGNSKQETRSGKNLCKLADKTDTSNGITSVITDGVVSVNGTATSTWFNLTTNQSFKLNAGTYTVSVNKALTQFGIDFYDSSGTVFSLAKNLTSAKITLSSEKIITRLIGVVANGEVLNIDGLTFQIEEGSVATEYEQYGASPSIESEAPIESVGDNINLLPNIVQTQTLNGLDITVNKDKSITIKGTTTANTAINYCEEITLPKGEYSFDFKNTSPFNLYYNVNGTNIVITNNMGTRPYGTFVLENDTTISKFSSYVVSGQTIDTTIYPKICKGTSTGAYSPYGQGSVEIYNCNKNLFNKEAITESYYLNQGNGVLGSSTSSNVSDYIPVRANETYIVTYDYETLVASGKRGYCYFDKNKTYLKGSEYTSSNKTFTLRPTEDGYIRFAYDKNCTNIQLEKGSTATEYVENQSQTKALYTQQPFRAIGDVKDRFVKVDGVWYEEHNVKRLILNGTENWGKSSNTNNNIFYIQAIFNILINKGMSNYFTYRIIWDIDLVGVEIYNNRNIRFGLGLNSDITTLEQWKAKLTELYNAGTPVYVDYVLKTPILIPCTMEQIEILDNLQSYDKITYYNVDKINNVQANIKLIYKQDINAILEEKGV